MPTLEERAKTLETGFGELKGRGDVAELEIHNIADLVRIEHRFTNSRVDRLDRQMVDMNGRMEGLESRMSALEGRMSSLESKVDALPRVLAEMIKGLSPQG